jgi:hypothetical protein
MDRSAQDLCTRFLPPKRNALTGVWPGSAARPIPASVKPIESIEVGDLVWALDMRSSRQVKRKVLKLFRNARKSVLTVTLGSCKGRQELIVCTREHPFWVPKKGWVAASELVAGDMVCCIDEVDAWLVLGLSTNALPEDVHNFEVSANHNYYVGSVGVLVHNSSEKQPESFGAFVQGARFKPSASTPEISLKYLNNTAQNTNFESEQHIERRAKSFFDTQFAEMSILAGVESGLRTPHSVYDRLNAHLVEKTTEFWQSMPDHVRNSIRSRLVGNDSNAVLPDIDISDDARGAMISLTEGSKTQLAAYPGNAAELVWLTKMLVDANKGLDQRMKDASSEVNKYRVHSIRKDMSNSLTPTGADLSTDMVSLMADEMELPVHLGNSASASSIASMLMVMANDLDGRFPKGISDNEGAIALSDLSFHYMRRGATPAGLRKRLEVLEQESGYKERRSIPDEYVLTHSYSEVFAGTYMTIERAKNSSMPAAQSALLWSQARLEGRDLPLRFLGSCGPRTTFFNSMKNPPLLFKGDKRSPVELDSARYGAETGGWRAKGVDSAGRIRHGANTDLESYVVSEYDNSIYMSFSKSAEVGRLFSSDRYLYLVAGGIPDGIDVNEVLQEKSTNDIEVEIAGSKWVPIEYAIGYVKYDGSVPGPFVRLPSYKK